MKLTGILQVSARDYGLGEQKVERVLQTII